MGRNILINQKTNENEATVPAGATREPHFRVKVYFHI